MRKRRTGLSLGDAVSAQAMLDARANDGFSRRGMPIDRKRRPGVDVPTPVTVGSKFPGVKPFALTGPAQFRPQPPVPLESPQWEDRLQRDKRARREGQHRRTPRQTEDARFWLVTGPADRLSAGAPARHRQEARPRRHRPFPVPGRRRRGGRARRRDGRQVQIRILAADHRHPNGDLDGNPATEPDAVARRHRQQRRCTLNTRVRTASSSSPSPAASGRAGQRRHPGGGDDELSAPGATTVPPIWAPIPRRSPMPASRRASTTASRPPWAARWATGSATTLRRASCSPSRRWHYK